MLRRQKSTWNIEDPTCREKQDDATTSVICVSVVHRDAHLVGKECNMQIRGESEFARTPALENCAFFTCVQRGYCGYLVLGGSAKELRNEEERHAIECKATRGLIGAGSRRAYARKRRVLRNTGGLRWITALFIAIARWL
jgi:hypothetical protein